jgi:hypothetical protein
MRQRNKANTTVNELQEFSRLEPFLAEWSKKSPLEYQTFLDVNAVGTFAAQVDGWNVFLSPGLGAIPIFPTLLTIF